MYVHANIFEKFEISYRITCYTNNLILEVKSNRLRLEGQVLVQQEPELELWEDPTMMDHCTQKNARPRV